MDSDDLERAASRRRVRMAVGFGGILVLCVASFVCSNVILVSGLLVVRPQLGARGISTDQSFYLPVAMLPIMAVIGLSLAHGWRVMRGREDLASIREEAPRSILIYALAAAAGPCVIGGMGLAASLVSVDSWMWSVPQVLGALMIASSILLGSWGGRRGWLAGQRGWMWAVYSSVPMVGLAVVGGGIWGESLPVIGLGLIVSIASPALLAWTLRWVVAPLARGEVEASLSRCWASPAPNLHRGMASLVARDFDAARKGLDVSVQATRGTAGSAIPLALQGWLRLLEGDLEAAGRSLKTSVEAHRTSIAELGLAELRLRSGEWEAMNAHLGSAASAPGSLWVFGLSKEPTFLRAFSSRCQSHAGHAQLAESLLREAREGLAEDDVLMRVVVEACAALVDEALGRHDAARETWERAKTFAPPAIRRWIDAHLATTSTLPAGG
jgi:hypothetical protein